MKNILYIHTHDSGRIISPYGYQVSTPNLQKFAQTATVFRNAYCVGPTCSPSRAGLLTGTYPHQNGMLGLAQRGFELDYQKHLVRYLNKHGYMTVLCGIQHESGWYLDRGEAAEKIGYQQELTTDSRGIAEEELIHWDKANADEVSHWLKSDQSGQPFFLSYGMFATHRNFPVPEEGSVLADYTRVPYPVPDTEETRKDFAGYLLSIQSADDCFGQVIEALKESGHWEDTIIIFTTDHGLANPFAKCTLFDSGIGVALMMRVPQIKGRVLDSLVSQIDIFPTICDLLELPKPEYLEGVSLLPLLIKEQKEVRQEIMAEINFHTSYEPARCIRNQRYKYIRYFDPEYLRINQSNIDESLTKDFFNEQGLQQYIKAEEALYDLTFDPSERNNLAVNAEYREIKEELKQKLLDWQIKTQDPILNGEIKIRPEWKVNTKQCQKAKSGRPEDYVQVSQSQ
ncbi:N-sulfoglucosamine sulfohydrolase [Clostridiales bacterium COT073_COT-073]|nr:N-sulfoglucosamine sulfohydrolase [Clostridiales bacterium COT073_COT-073]